MSERGAFFESASQSATKPKPLPTRGDFFAGTDIDLPKKVQRTGAEKAALLAKYPDPFKKTADVADAIFHMGSSVVATPVSGLIGLGASATNALGITDTPAADVIEKVAGALTYQPHTQEGQDVAAAVASPDVNPLAVPGALGEDWADMATDAGAPPWLATGIRTLPDALVAGLGLRGALSRRPVSTAEAPGAPIREPVNAYARAPVAEPIDPQAALNKAASSQSMGAAGAAVDLQKLSPTLKAAVKQAVQETGGAVNPEAMARHIQADSLPVKVPLSEGQVLGDARLISEERNARGKTPGAVEAFNGQNKALVENLRAFRDTAGDEVFSTNQVEHADTLIGRYKAIDEVREADIGAKYQALRDAAGGAFPVDAKALLDNTRAALKKDLATSHAPPDVMGALEEYATSGSMTLEDFEGLRTSLARTQRSAADGQVRHAAGVIRDQIEKIPLQAGAERLKGLADTARAAARERFQALEADPAYKAAVNETTPPDKFVQKFIIGGTRDNVARLSAAMADDTAAAQTLKVATLDHLRQAAGVDASFNNNFSQAGYNKALRALEPKLGSLLDPALLEHVQNLGDVARYSQFQPEGHFVNNSNSGVALIAEKAASAAEKLGNLAVPGLDAGTFVRERASAAAAARKVKKSWGPGAGLTRLSDLSKVGKDKP